MKKILIIGTNPSIEIIEGLKARFNEPVEITIVENENDKLPIVFDQVVNLKPLQIQTISLMDMPFIPKTKNKGYERTYKYHR